MYNGRQYFCVKRGGGGGGGGDFMIKFVGQRVDLSHVPSILVEQLTGVLYSTVCSVCT